MNNPIDSTSLFYSRDLIEYKEYLAETLLNDWNEWQKENLENEYEAEDVEEAIRFSENLKSNGSVDFLIDYSGEISEYEAVENFCNELDYGAFTHGETIISENYFTEYCEDLVKDCGYISNDLPAFIENNIDWDSVADDLEIDYTKGEFEGTTYLMRV